MNRYQLAKIVSWAGKLETRKRLQKVVFMLQSKNCPLRASFYLHHFGPYSDDVARLTDEMVRHNLLVETADELPGGMRYSYHLPESVVGQLEQLEQTNDGRKWAAELAPFEQTAKQLLESEVRSLEYASTILFFQHQVNDWQTAVEKASEFKKTENVRKALSLAQSVLS